MDIVEDFFFFVYHQKQKLIFQNELMQMCLHFVLNGYFAIHKIKKGIDGLFCDALLVSLIF